jgi:hypothetical protein
VCNIQQGNRYTHHVYYDIYKHNIIITDKPTTCVTYTSLLPKNKNNKTTNKQTSTNVVMTKAHWLNKKYNSSARDWIVIKSKQKVRCSVNYFIFVKASQSK